MFTGYGLISALATLAIPTSLSLGGFPALMLARVFQGFGAASVWVVIGKCHCHLPSPLLTHLHSAGGISAQWAPLASSAVFLSVLSCNLQFGPILSMPLAAQLCLSQEWGWPAVYHILGTISLLAFGLFFFFFRDLPRQQKQVHPIDPWRRKIAELAGMCRPRSWR
jgi:MFS family permease